MWGVEGINKTLVDFFNASDIGTTIWDNEFDMSHPIAQQELFDFCKNLKGLRSLLFAPESVECWIEDFSSWLKKNGKKFPTESKEFESLILRFSEQDPKGKKHREVSNIGFIDGKLVFMKFIAKSVGNPYDPYAIKNPIRDRWEEQLAKFRENAYIGIKNVKQTAGLDWCWMIMELQLVNTMKSGLWMSIVFALVVLIFSTQNVIIAILSSITIALIIVNVVALIPINQWQLGSGESVSVVCCIGFSVDYVVHLGGHYSHS